MARWHRCFPVQLSYGFRLAPAIGETVRNGVGNSRGGAAASGRQVMRRQGRHEDHHQYPEEGVHRHVYLFRRGLGLRLLERFLPVARGPGTTAAARSRAKTMPTMKKGSQ